MEEEIGRCGTVMRRSTKEFTEALQFQTGHVPSLDDDLLLRAQRIQAGVRQRIQRYRRDSNQCGDRERTRPIPNISCGQPCAAISLHRNRLGRANASTLLALGAQLCNIGMMAIPTRILQKLRDLSDGERHVVQAITRDTGLSCCANRSCKFSILQAVIAEQHHERYDGSGYPRGLSGEAIAEEARIVAICDAFDAMTHRRPSRRHATVY